MIAHAVRTVILAVCVRTNCTVGTSRLIKAQSLGCRQLTRGATHGPRPKKRGPAKLQLLLLANSSGGSVAAFKHFPAFRGCKLFGPFSCSNLTFSPKSLV